MLGRKHSEETKRKMSITKKANPKPAHMKGKLFKKGQVPWNKGNKEFMKGARHWNWQGGISKRKGYRDFIENRRRARKLQNGGQHSWGDWETLKAQYNFTCPSCKKCEPHIKLGVDHIIPISKGGSDNIENIQPLCKPCNSRKHTATTKFLSDDFRLPPPF